MPKQTVAVVAVAGLGIAGAAHADAGATAVGAGTTNVGVQSFMNFGNISNPPGGLDVVPTGTGFDVKRVYLIVDHRFDEVWTSNLTIDGKFSEVGPYPQFNF